MLLSTEQSCLPNIRNLNRNLMRGKWKKSKTLVSGNQGKNKTTSILCNSSFFRLSSRLRTQAVSQRTDQASPDLSSVPPSAPDVSFLVWKLRGMEVTFTLGIVITFSWGLYVGWIRYKSSLRKEGLIWDHNLRRQSPLWQGRMAAGVWGAGRTVSVLRKQRGGYWYWVHFFLFAFSLGLGPSL